jgi:hypothetical protein
MNTQDLLKKIDDLKYKFITEQTKGENPTRLYLDGVHAHKLEWFCKEHMYGINVNTPLQSFLVYSGMRVYPVLCVDEHIFVA